MASERLKKKIAENKVLMDEIKEHIYDCGFGEMDEINSYSNLHLVRCMDIDYAGGVEQFIMDIDMVEHL